MKSKTKKMALATSMVVATGALAGCGLFLSEKEKFLTAIENLPNQTGTSITKISLDTNLDGEDKLKSMLDKSYVEITSAYDEKTKAEEVRFKVISLVTLEGYSENLNVEFNFNIFVEEGNKKAYLDIGTLRDDIAKILAQSDKFDNDLFGVESNEEKEKIFKDMLDEFENGLEGKLGIKFSDDKEEYAYIDLAKLAESDEELKELLANADKENEKVEKIAATVLKKTFGTFAEERFKKSSLQLGLVETFDAVVKALESEDLKTSLNITKEEQEILDEALVGLKDSRQGLVDSMKDVDVKLSFDYKIKKEEFKELDFTVNITEDGQSVAVKVENDYSKKVEFVMKDKIKGATTVDLTPLIEDAGYGTEVGALAGGNAAATTVTSSMGLGALLYPYIMRLNGPPTDMPSEHDMTNGITDGLPDYSENE